MLFLFEVLFFGESVFSSFSLEAITFPIFKLIIDLDSDLFISLVVAESWLRMDFIFESVFISVSREGCSIRATIQAEIGHVVLRYTV